MEYLYNVGLVLTESLGTAGTLTGFGRAAPLASHLLGGLRSCSTEMQFQELAFPEG